MEDNEMETIEAQQYWNVLGLITSMECFNLRKHKNNKDDQNSHLPQAPTKITLSKNTDEYTRIPPLRVMPMPKRRYWGANILDYGKPKHKLPFESLLKAIDIFL
jgi:hypothetical protein